MENEELELEELDEAIQDCPVCDGDGEVVAWERVTPRSIDVPYKVCPACKGTRIKN